MRFSTPLLFATSFVAACTTTASQTDDIHVERLELSPTGAVLLDETDAAIGRIDLVDTGESLTTTTTLAGHQLVRTLRGDTLTLECQRDGGGEINGAVCNASLDANELFDAAVDWGGDQAKGSALLGCWVHLNECWDGGYSCNGNGQCSLDQVGNACRSLGQHYCRLWGYEP